MPASRTKRTPGFNTQEPALETAMPPSPSSRTTIVVGIFDPPGDAVSQACVNSIQWIVKQQEGWQALPVTVGMIDSGGLLNLGVDVFVIPGGLPQKIAQLLTNSTIRKLREWRTTAAGGYVGICAGAIVACCRGKEGRGFVPGVGVVENNALESTDAIDEVVIKSVVAAGATTAASAPVTARDKKVNNRAITSRRRTQESMPPVKFLEALEQMKAGSIPYCNGPIFKLTSSIKDRETRGSQKKTGGKRTGRNRNHCGDRVHIIGTPASGSFSHHDQEADDTNPSIPASSTGNIRVSVWATYESDIGDNLQAAQDARMREYQRGYVSSNKHRNNKGRGRRHPEPVLPSGGWTCWSCGAPHRKNDRACCSRKRREHLMQQNGVERLRGIMKGRPAIVAVEEREQQQQQRWRRSVLMGPHPELGYDGAPQLLVESIRYCAHDI